MNRETLILIFAIPIILLYIVYVYLKAKEQKKKNGKQANLISY